MEPSPANLSLVAFIALCNYLCYLCGKSPNPRPKKQYSKDRIKYFANDTIGTEIISALLLSSLWVFQSALILFPAHRSEFCLNPDSLNENLFSWSRDTLTFVAIVLIGASIRLLAYAHLGTNFTFRLARPKGIITSGIYGYVQHPSYTGLGLLIVAMCFLFGRVDGLGACFLPSWVINTTGANVTALLVGNLGVFFGLLLRVGDEEEMMQKEFGKEWLEYHQRTKRFIPWVI